MASSPRVSELEQSPSAEPMGFAIRLPSAQLADLIQINCLNRVRAAFRVSSGAHEGYLYFDAGRLIHAELGDTSGLDAVVRMLGLRGGSIEPCARAFPSECSIDMGADALLLHAAQQVDERSRPSSVPEEATTKVVRRAEWPRDARAAQQAGNGEDTAPAARPSQWPPSGRVEVAQVTSDGVIRQLKAGASTDLADTAFYCHELGQRIGAALGLGECRAVCLEGVEEGIVVFKGRNIVGARGRLGDLGFVRERLGLG